MPDATALPDDMIALKALLLQRDSEVQQLRSAVSTLEQALNVRALEIEQLKLQIAKLKRMHFGRKSEKIDCKIEQLETRLEDLIAEGGASEQEVPAAAPAGARAASQPLPEHLPRDERIYEPDETVCVQCGGGFKYLGDDVSEELEIIGAAFKVLRHVRRKRACACCDRIIQGAAPSRPIARGIAGPGRLAQIIVAKFADHQPLYRQAAIYARQGVELDRSTMARWVGACGALVRPLVDALRRYVLAPGKVHTDDTTMPVLAPGNGQTRTARMWVYVRDDRRSGSVAAPAAWFAYTPNRQGIHPQTHLAGFRGVLQADAYAGYDKVFADGHVREAACMAHARRKIHDLHTSKVTVTTTEALRRIAQLYELSLAINQMMTDPKRILRSAPPCALGRARDVLRSPPQHACARPRAAVTADAGDSAGRYHA